MSFFHRIHALIRKELQALLGDPSSRTLLFLPVIMQTLLFPFAATLDVENASLAIFNRDTGPESLELVQRFAASPAFSTVLSLNSEAEVETAIDTHHALLAVNIPADFSRKLARGEASPLQVVLDGRRSNGAQIALSYLQGITQEFTLDRLDAAGRTLPSTVVTRFRYNPNLNYRHFILPNLIAIITTIGALIVTALSVAREREQGTFDQLLVSPLTPEMIMIGKAVPAMIVGFFQATLILCAAVFIYHVPFRGNLLLLYAGMFLYSLSLVGVGLFISSLCSTQQQAFLGAFSFMMPAIMLSGFAAPVENMPRWLQIADMANPVRHFVEVVKGVFLKDTSFHHVLADVIPLIGIAFVTLSAASILFRQRST
ncbi:ABC-2 type transport system permease protein [Haloferula luteola]|uniref:ABC-2 type transport system permease protein n=1 Tax=Haloferula luteola TaxID=595692 RepID=A0A840VAM2_9BACT|nr:ABC transporter permease [Haloferula luteola]MBB5350990.1 ABC-2 type transport system permease protein [Haloferula luteola]